MIDKKQVVYVCGYDGNMNCNFAKIIITIINDEYKFLFLFSSTHLILTVQELEERQDRCL